MCEVCIYHEQLYSTLTVSSLYARNQSSMLLVRLHQLTHNTPRSNLMISSSPLTQTDDTGSMTALWQMTVKQLIACHNCAILSDQLLHAN